MSRSNLYRLPAALTKLWVCELDWLKSVPVRNFYKKFSARRHFGKKGKFLQLPREVEALQQRLLKGIIKRDLATISKEFRDDRMQKAHVNVIKLLTNKMQGEVLPLNEKTINLLRQKHPKSQNTNEDFLLWMIASYSDIAWVPIEEITCE